MTYVFILLLALIALPVLYWLVAILTSAVLYTFFGE